MVFLIVWYIIAIVIGEFKTRFLSAVLAMVGAFGIIVSYTPTSGGIMSPGMAKGLILFLGACGGAVAGAFVGILIEAIFDRDKKKWGVVLTMVLFVGYHLAVRYMRAQ